MKMGMLVFLVPLMLFGRDKALHEDVIGHHTIEAYDADKIKEAWTELGLPTLSEDKKVFRKKWVRWIAKKENQSRLLQKIKTQVTEGGLESSRELLSMIASLESALVEWNKTYTSKDSLASRARSKIQLGYLACYIKQHKDEEINEDNVEERIQELREQEKLHKDEAFELVSQAGGEAIASGVCAAGGMEIPAIAEGIQSTRHFVKGCKEYNEGVRCQQEADALEKQYLGSENELENKEWWEFWK